MLRRDRHDRPAPSATPELETWRTAAQRVARAWNAWLAVDISGRRARTARTSRQWRKRSSPRAAWRARWHRGAGSSRQASGPGGQNAEFFALAFSTVLNPKVLGIDLLLIANSRPRMMFLCFLLGGIGMSVTVGFLDVLVPPVKARGAGGFMPFRRCAALPPGVASAPGSPQTAMCKLEEGCNEHGRAEALRG